ncbi:MAG: hypothetical protein DPW09_07950 [Anaerolineae bacterium]|nr:hypothetical protein [Anaerolineales bacterium]MCQ3973360.1 hypothetical protein [Anaerolineae bacterium]
MRLQTIIILGLTLAGFALRLYYLTTTHPFFDEYTTVLAARQILAYGWPVLPSGLFYEHGLLSTYVIAPFTALFINTPLDDWQPAHWGLMLARWPSAVIGTFTIPLIYVIGRQFNNQWSTSNLPTFQPSNLPTSISLLAAGLFAFSPEGMVWGGRARMYALATLLVLLMVFWAYRGAVYPAPARYRWGAIAALLAALLTQFGVLILVPPLVVAMIVIGWISRQGSGVSNQKSENSSQINIPHAPRTTHHASRPWFLRPTILLEILTLAAVVGIAVGVKRLGQPVGMAALGSEEEPLLSTLLETVTYQTAFALNGAAIRDFLAEQFGPPHLFWLALATLVSVAVGLLVWLFKEWRISEWRTGASAERPLRSSPPRLLASSTLFLWLTFGLILLEMVTVLDPFRQNPRYLVMYLPLFYLIAADSVSRVTYHVSRFVSPLMVSLGLIVVFTLLSLPDLRLALVTPEPAYEAAFQMVRDNWQPDDALLTMNTPAAALYHGQADGFTAQVDADQFLLNKASAPTDRWLGAPWIGTAADFNAALNTHPRVWFVIDTIRQPVYFRGDWQAVVNSQMEPVWSQDNALVYRTRPNRIPLPTQPQILVNARLGDTIELIGYTLQTDPPQPINPNSADFNLHAGRPISNLKITLFWRPLHPPTADYTVFLHLRDQANTTLAQQDGLSLAGNYPSSRWQPGETVIDPFSLTLLPDLPPGRYTLWAGMYQLDTLERLTVTNDASGENAILLGEINYQ